MSLGAGQRRFNPTPGLTTVRQLHVRHALAFFQMTRSAYFGIHNAPLLQALGVLHQACKP
jgi:hypothetical protein